MLILGKFTVRHALPKVLLHTMPARREEGSCKLHTKHRSKGKTMCKQVDVEKPVPDDSHVEPCACFFS